jgi:hypothetical protein
MIVLIGLLIVVVSSFAIERSLKKSNEQQEEIITLLKAIRDKE